MATLTKRTPILCAAMVLVATAARGWAELPINVLSSFNGTNGMNPQALTLSGNGNTLYGTTYQGGASNYGTVFSVPVAGGTPAVLASFNGANGANPYAGLTLSGNTLYGTATQGGAANLGTVYSVPITGGTPAVLTSFNNGPFYQASPYGGLILSQSRLYGTTYYGGDGNWGTVFSVPVTGGIAAVRASFGLMGHAGYPPWATNPRSGLTLSRDGNTLYGTTQYGLASTSDSGLGYGNVFSVTISGGPPTVLATFNRTDGAYPQADLTLSTDGTTLYGTTPQGGAGNKGTVFSVPVTGGTVTVLASFNGSNGTWPQGGLTLSGNTLFGTTTGGGAFGFGTAFSVPITGGTATVLASFNGTNGKFPAGDLTLSADGTTLYGTTQYGGSSDYGTVFSITLPIPEPTSLAVLGLGAAVLLIRRHRRGNRSGRLTSSYSEA